jgi:hypothetical protein
MGDFVRKRWYPTEQSNDAAGTWTTKVPADFEDQAGATFTLQRWASFEGFNSSPEPVSKGRAITVVGKLARGNWDDYRYHGYVNQGVDLQFRTTSGSCARVKTVNTNSVGQLRTTGHSSVGRLLPLVLPRNVNDTARDTRW